jgi:hypothetical protein
LSEHVEANPQMWYTYIYADRIEEEKNSAKPIVSPTELKKKNTSDSSSERVSDLDNDNIELDS